MFSLLKKIFGTAQDRLLRKYSKIVNKVNEWDEKYKTLTDDELRQKTNEFKERIQKGETTDQLLPEAYGVVKNVCRRFCGTEVHVSGYNQKWDMVPFDVQIIGAIAMHHGAISEMQTGEGKTLTAVMPLYLNALTGKAVHLVTVNDYLVQRDCQWVGSILRWLGLTTGALTNDTQNRKEVYGCDVVYGTSSEFGFDYLRDNSMAFSKNQQVQQKGHYYAIIDEVDSILVDEARTPLIISGPVPNSRQMYDELKGGVSEIVRFQRDLCNRLANEARKVLETGLTQEETKKTKQRIEEEKEAFRKLWLVSKGTPHNKTLKKLKENPDYRSAIDEWDLYYYSEQNKEEKIAALSALYMTVDEKASEFELTDKGIASWQHMNNQEGNVDDFIMLDISEEFLKIDENRALDENEKMKQKVAIQEEDAKRKERAHNLRQLLRAHLLMEKDVDYIVHENKIVIIDENTGRPQPGRRFSDGLHQAIEAKEGVEIQKETQTYATITIQNYFRMYDKLSGMTGTAMTEANEFKEIYKLDVLSIPTHKKCIREDANDEIYMTEREKYNAILNEIKAVHEKGRPILIGTESVEVSEKLSRILRQHHLEHTVLNARYHEKEAEIIALAGGKGAITIATNMAGRGTDIKLDPGIADLGGLLVIGSTRHQSRRIDRQLRGRCARQGDPGSSKFFISFEDSLLRLFASPRITSVLKRFRPPEGEAISARMLDRSIEAAQKRVEQRNYSMRKNTLQYDDVMNKQRQAIYSFRNDILHSEEVIPLIEDLLLDVCAIGAEKFFINRSQEGGWNPEGYRQWLLHLFPVTIEEGYFDDDLKEREELEKLAFEKIVIAFREKMARENSKVPVMQMPGMPVISNPANEAARNLMIRKLDQLWQEHLLRMDHLRTDVNLRTVAQRDPLLEFKHEAFSLFNELNATLRTQIAHDIFRFEILTAEQIAMRNMAMAGLILERNRSFANELQENPPEEEKKEKEPSEEIKSKPAKAENLPGRNELCPCGSGKKYKKCCGIALEASSAT